MDPTTSMLIIRHSRSGVALHSFQILYGANGTGTDSSFFRDRFCGVFLLLAFDPRVIPMVTCFFPFWRRSWQGRFRLGWDGHIPSLHCSFRPFVWTGLGWSGVFHQEEVLIFQSCNTAIYLLSIVLLSYRGVTAQLYHARGILSIILRPLDRVEDLISTYQAFCHSPSPFLLINSPSCLISSTRICTHSLYDNGSRPSNQRKTLRLPTNPLSS